MIKKGSIRRVYPGGNTYKGFHSFYDYILDQKVAKKIYIIKGGPGVGKSSFMKKLGKHMSDKGFDVEYHHCSSDNNSIDGVVFHQVGVALIDGTFPHVVDPRNPGGVDEILNFGKFWDEDEIVKNKDEIIKDNKELSRFFKRAYGYLAAAKGIYDNIKNNTNEAIDYSRVNLLIEDISSTIFTNSWYNKSLGKERHLFGSAVTPDGIKDYLDTLITPNKKIILLKGQYNSCQSFILEIIGKMATDMGCNVEYFHNHFNPEEVSNIVIKDISAAITTSDKFENISNKVINVDESLNKKIIKERENEIVLDNNEFKKLIDLAVYNINNAKKIHDHLESYYIPNMDFDRINLLRERILEKILSWT